MGLCKCPKKKVTNLFCFEHRVNVCENCLVSNHSKCVVQSYLQWLQDSDYNPNCTLCNRLLSDEECGECVRLLCYDVYHWACLNAYAHQLPGNTAPAGYTCPGCSAAVFPASNQVSPVADALRKTLSQVNWARAGLGLPLIDEPPPQPTAPPKLEQNIPTQSPNGPNGRSVMQHADVPQQANSQTVSSTPYLESSRGIGTQHVSTPVTGHSVVNIDEGAPFSRIEKPNPRKLFDARDDSRLNTSYDHDENKYERRSAFNFLSKFSRSRSSQNRKEPGSMYKKFLMVLVIGLIGLVTVVIIFSKMGRSATMSDPLLDPLANPNIRIERNPGNVM